jgi:hypothetical protein
MKKLIFLAITLTVLLAGCGTSTSNGASGVTEIKFKDMPTFAELEKLDGKKVSLTGFMATISPLQGLSVYLINMPYQNCPFCKPNSTELVNTMAVYAPENKPFDFTDIPVTMTGILELGDFSDELGYSYKYRIVDAEATPADISGYEDEIKLYTALVDQGFALQFNAVLNELYSTIDYETAGTDPATLKPIDTAKIDELEAMFNTLEKDDYKEVVTALAKLDGVVTEVNKAIESKKNDKLALHMPNAEDAYNQFYAWLMLPEI